MRSGSGGLAKDCTPGSGCPWAFFLTLSSNEENFGSAVIRIRDSWVRGPKLPLCCALLSLLVLLAINAWSVGGRFGDETKLVRFAKKLHCIRVRLRQVSHCIRGSGGLAPGPG